VGVTWGRERDGLPGAVYDGFELRGPRFVQGERGDGALNNKPEGKGVNILSTRKIRKSDSLSIQNTSELTREERQREGGSEKKSSY